MFQSHLLFFCLFIPTIPFSSTAGCYRGGLISPSEDARPSLMSSPGSTWSSSLLLMLGNASFPWSRLCLRCPHCLLSVVHVLSFQFSPLWTLCAALTSLLITCRAVLPSSQLVPVLPHCTYVALALSMPACEQVFWSVHWPQSIERAHIPGSCRQ